MASANIPQNEIHFKALISVQFSILVKSGKALCLSINLIFITHSLGDKREMQVKCGHIWQLSNCKLF